VHGRHHNDPHLHQRSKEVGEVDDDPAVAEAYDDDHHGGKGSHELDADSKASSITMGDAASIPEPSRKALGGGWERIEESGNVFYYNTTTNEVRNDPPEGV
jgi:hypothetical protein